MNEVTKRKLLDVLYPHDAIDSNCVHQKSQCYLSLQSGKNVPLSSMSYIIVPILLFFEKLICRMHSLGNVNINIIFGVFCDVSAECRTDSRHKYKMNLAQLLLEPKEANILHQKRKIMQFNEVFNEWGF